MGRGRRLVVKGHALAVAEDLLCELQNAPLTWMSLLNVSPSTDWFPSIASTRVVCVTRCDGDKVSATAQAPLFEAASH